MTTASGLTSKAKPSPLCPGPPAGRSTVTRLMPRACCAACDDGLAAATVHVMTTAAGPPAAFGSEADLLGALFSPAGRADPHVILRSSALPGCQYLFVRDVLRDPGFAAPSIPPSSDAAFQLLARWMMRLDGDRHRRLRDAFGGLFTARRVERYRAIIAERAAALIDQAAAAGSMDLVADFARPLPFTVITEVLGVPPGDREGLAAALATLNRGFARQRDADRTAVHAANDAARQMMSYFTELLEQRAAAPADDLMTALAAQHAEGEERQDLIANCIFFINAGHQTTTTLLTLGTHLLCTHPQALAALKEDPGRWPAAVEEMLLFFTPTAFTASRAQPGRHACCSWPPPTATPPPSLIRISSISAATQTRTSASPPEPTSAWAPPWPGSTAKSR